MVAQSHLTVNVMCTFTVLSLFIPAAHFFQTLLPVWHHIPEDTLFIIITISTSGLTCGTLSNRLALLILVLCLAQAISHWPGLNPRPICVEFVVYRVSLLQISALAPRSSPVHNAHSSPLLYNLII